MRVTIEMDDGTRLVFEGRSSCQEAIKALALGGVNLTAKNATPRTFAPQPAVAPAEAPAEAPASDQPAEIAAEQVHAP